MHRPPTPPRRGAIAKVALPVLLFVAIIAGVAWMTQYMPNWRGTPVEPPIDKGRKTRGEITEAIKFTRVRAVWEFDERGEDTGYVREYERGVEGRYYFPFQNVLDEPAELGLLGVSCDCTYMDVAVLPAAEFQRVESELREKPWADVKFEPEPPWQKVTRDSAGAKVPAKGVGLVRISWKGRKDSGEQLRIGLRVFSQAEGTGTAARRFETIDVAVVMANPVRSEPERQSVGVLGPGDVGKAEFHLWSPTRDREALDLAVKPRADQPLHKYELRPLDDAECKALQERLQKEKKVFTKVRAGYHLTATVHESKGGQQLDQGPFQFPPPLTLDELPIEFPTALVSGTVKGDVLIGNFEAGGKVVLKSFPSREGTRKVVPVYAPAKYALEVAEQHPSALQVKLVKNAKESAGDKMRWDLEIVVPPNGIAGPLPEHSAIILRSSANPPRLIRIPVLGNATLSGPG